MKQDEIRAVVFDLDGTLADTLADIGGAMNRTLAKHGYPTHTLDAYRDFIGEGVRTLAVRALPAGARHDAGIDQLVVEYRAEYQAHMLDETQIYEGVPELLDALTARKIMLAVLSNKSDAATRPLVEQLFARWKFAAIAGERQGIPRKPDPTSALEIARMCGLPPGACAFVGDTRIDMATARAAGMRAVGVTWGFRDRAELEGAGADRVIDHPNQLIPLLGR